ncbi:MAG: ABC transporter ATP-binding protein [Acidimicrobiia bacterium]|nr:ABC transporter ATP-binding protein [Acidimicrobiia bacterium]
MASTPHTPQVATRHAAEVALDGVTVSYDGVEAVSDVSLVVPGGSITALLGPSGCGKTSLLRAIAGLERPTAGTVTVGDRPVSGPGTWVHPERRHVGMVFQDGALFPHLTVAQNVDFGLRAAGRHGRRLGRSERTDRVRDALELVDLAGLGDRLPDTLSGGQQQRVALARSLAPQPAVLLLDEPFSALDATLRVQVRAEVADILREVEVTTVFVTHDQDEAFVLGDRVAVLHEGRIEQVGTPDDLYRRPATPWVAGFVGEANFVQGLLGAALADDGGTEHGGDAPPTGHAATLLGSVPVSLHERSDAETPMPPEEAPHTEIAAPAENPTADEAAAISVLVRPEHVSLHPGRCALVTNVEYYGHDVRYELELKDGSTLAARTTSSHLYARGDRVCVRYEGEMAEAWPA